MEPGDTITYEGAALRAATMTAVEVEGVFVAVEQRDVDGELRWLVEDLRAADFKKVAGDDQPFDADVHRYLLPATFSGDEDRPTE